ncbi:protein mono-ADP-ribosyltransferase PARP11-like [Eucyclogobius newberryi]|uniref:protein mono-ADP-ribosyltransferase PARP11-like n=1 Tax=Eucyclogobius newberryi TaxID=166745 RepID=UPI003B5978A5
MADMWDTVEVMDTSDRPWSWYYLADCGQWHRVEDDPDNPLISQDIDNYYLQHSSRDFTFFLSDSHLSRIDFTAMLQTDIKTGRQRRIQRSFDVENRCSCFSAAPVFWEQMDASCPYQLMPLNYSSAEYLTVANYMKRDGLLDRPIVSICRIQNQDLWEFYCRKKKQLMRIHGDKDVKEMRLFHGTKKHNVHSICKYNFDLTLAGSHGHVFGKGIYFAKHAAYADKYSHSCLDALPLFGGKPFPTTDKKTKVIFLARVLVGKSTLGDKKLTKPDGVEGERCHDSCVDHIVSPKMYVIFDCNQIYPEYLIEYT